MRRSAAAVGVGVLVALVVPVFGGERAAPARDGARVLDHQGKWESGYGAKFYSVVGRLKNTSDHALRYVKLRIEALDAKGKKVASVETYNESAESLAVEMEGIPNDLAERLKTMQPKPLAAGAEERFRGGFMEDETPPFTSYRVEVVETLRADP